MSSTNYFVSVLNILLLQIVLFVCVAQRFSISKVMYPTAQKSKTSLWQRSCTLKLKVKLKKRILVKFPNGLTRTSFIKVQFHCRSSFNRKVNVSHFSSVTFHSKMFDCLHAICWISFYYKIFKPFPNKAPFAVCLLFFGMNQTYYYQQ